MSIVLQPSIPSLLPCLRLVKLKLHFYEAIGGLPITKYNTGTNGISTNIYGGKGRMPHYHGIQVINGGLPQLGDLDEHLT
jgi:hypothetical protein